MVEVKRGSCRAGEPVKDVETSDRTLIYMDGKKVLTTLDPRIIHGNMVYGMYINLFFKYRDEMFANTLNHPDYVFNTNGINLIIYIKYTTAENMYKTSLQIAEVMYNEYKRQQEETMQEEARKERIKQEQKQLQNECRNDILAIFELLEAVQRK